MFKKFGAVLFFAGCLAIAGTVKAATPSSKSFSSNDYSQDCGQGKRGLKCGNFESLNFSFDFPTQREDGSPLDLKEISHFVVQFEKDGGMTIQFAIPKTNNFDLLKMPSGSYVFRVATVDTNGNQGSFSSDQPVNIP